MIFKGAFLNIELISEKTAAYWIQVCFKIHINILNIFRIDIIICYEFTSSILSGGEGAQSGFPRKSSDREYHVQVLIYQAAIRVISYGNPYLSIQSMVVMPILK